MKRIKLIFNPHADRGRAWDIASSLKGIIAGKGEFDWASTEYPGHATKIAPKAALDGDDVVAALGGDGEGQESGKGGAGAMLRPPAGRLSRRPAPDLLLPAHTPAGLRHVPVGGHSDDCP